MKTKNSQKSVPAEPSEDDIREYAYHLYLQSGCVPGRDLDNWLEAKACLRACIPPEHSHTRLHRNKSLSQHLSSSSIKTDSAPAWVPSEPLNDDDIREYAHHLYVQDGHKNNRCMDYWMEAKACLEACIPKSESHIRLHYHSQKQKPQASAGTKVQAA